MCVSSLDLHLLERHDAAKLIAQTPDVFHLGPTEIDGSRTPFGPLQLESLCTQKGIRDRIVAMCVDALDDLGLTFDIVAGCESAGMPLALAIADLLAADFVAIRKRGFARHSPLEQDICGIWSTRPLRKRRVLVVDDGVWSGASIGHSERVIRTGGGIVAGSLVLVDFSMLIRYKPAAELASLHTPLCPIYAVTSFPDVVCAAAEEGLFSAKVLELALEWIEGDWMPGDPRWRVLEMEPGRCLDDQY